MQICKSSKRPILKASALVMAWCLTGDKAPTKPNLHWHGCHDMALLCRNDLTDDDTGNTKHKVYRFRKILNKS